MFIVSGAINNIDEHVKQEEEVQTFVKDFLESLDNVKNRILNVWAMYIQTPELKQIDYEKEETTQENEFDLFVNKVRSLKDMLANPEEIEPEVLANDVEEILSLAHNVKESSENEKQVQFVELVVRGLDTLGANTHSQIAEALSQLEEVSHDY
ncbi:MAG: hypothetical protein N3A69_00415 [Leptospiraceae bacterium]|nr:hypothetical protein [Leptospiraceae bacterium]